MKTFNKTLLKIYRVSGYIYLGSFIASLYLVVLGLAPVATAPVIGVMGFALATLGSRIVND